MSRLQQLHFPMHHKTLLPGEHTTSQVLCILHHWPCAFCLQWLGQLILQTRFHEGMCVKQRGYRNIKGSCLAYYPVSQQKVSRMGVAMIGCEVIASFHLDAKMAQWHVSARTSGRVLCHATTSPPLLQVMA